MPTKKVRILSAVMTGGLVLAGVTASVVTTGHAPTRSALAAKVASSPPVNLDNCPVLAEGYQGGCVNQLQNELNADNGTDMPVDGIFGPETKNAVKTFQDNHRIVPADGIVGSQTKAALDIPGSSPVVAPIPAASGNSAAASPASANTTTPAAPTSAPGLNSGKLYIRVCGIVTCSIYYSHQATVKLAEELTYIGSPADVTEAAGLVCAVVFAEAPPIAAGCGALSIAAFLSKQILNTINHAAATAGCVRFRSLDGINNVVSAVYADHSASCHSMDT